MFSQANETPPASRFESRPGAPLSLKALTVACWLAFVVFLVVPCAVILLQNVQRGQFLQKTPERDFIFFYSMGRMLNEYPPAQLYDYQLQKKVATSVHPLRGREYGPNPYPPFVGVLFRPFALLPFVTAYLLWLSISAGLYSLGLIIITRRFFPIDPLRRSLCFCFALSFLPFVWIMIGGQIPTIGFLGLALSFREEDRDRPFLGGLALSLCLCKPTLVILIVPMLLLSRRTKTLLGFATGAMALVLFATAFEGPAVWAGYVRMLLIFGTAATRTHGFRDLLYYMDLASFSSLVRGGRSFAGAALILSCSCFAAVALARAWWESAHASKPVTTLILATTVVWTLVLNVYVPIYDSILAVVAVIATAAVLRQSTGPRLQGAFRVIWICILIAAWATLPVAKATGFQMLTPLFAALGTVQLIALREIGRGTASKRPLIDPSGQNEEKPIMHGRA